MRAASGTPVQETNCRPFRHERWLFQHNGIVPRWTEVERRLLFDVEPALFPHVQGSTDSEVLFLLALGSDWATTPGARSIAPPRPSCRRSRRRASTNRSR